MTSIKLIFPEQNNIRKKKFIRQTKNTKPLDIEIELKPKVKSAILSILIFFTGLNLFAQTFSGKVMDEQGNPVSDVSVLLVEEKKYTVSDANGNWTLQGNNVNEKTLVFNKNGFTYEQLVYQKPADGLEIKIRKTILSAASLREDDYIMNGCSDINIPNNKEWNNTFELSPLEGDLAPDSKYTRRDPSAVILVNGLYYVYYSYSLTHDSTKLAPWDRNDIYYATSTDGWDWDEKGPAVKRGNNGSFDARSVFTTEIFVHEGKYYLVYQAAKDEDGIYNRNTVGMSVADSPDGPWTKLEKPILHPTYTNDLFFDNNAVHDPCLVFYKNKFYLYYKGECNCRDNAGCKNWCNPVCGLNKQVKWGVAIADNPTGPYIKSEYNPVTNTGHEVMVWPYQNGVAILQHQDGPEANSIQFAEDGVNFVPQGMVSNIPEAAGLFRAAKSETDPHAGIEWGLGHKLMWNDGPKGWMYIYRFDKVSKEPTGLNLVPEKIQLGIGQKRNVSVKLEPHTATTDGLNWLSKNENIATIANSQIVGVNLGETVIYLKSENKRLIDSCMVVVQKEYFDANTVLVPANSYKQTGGDWNDASYGGNGFGANKTATGINFVNRNDWCLYDVNITQTGVYELSYEITTPMAYPEISVDIGNVRVANDEVYTNGAWDSYYTLNSDGLITFNKTGSNEIELLATGADTWQWNLKSITLTRLRDLDLNVHIDENKIFSSLKLFSNPESKKLFIQGIMYKYNVSLYTLLGQKCHSSNHYGNSVIQLGNRFFGTYLVQIRLENNIFSTKVFL